LLIGIPKTLGEHLKTGVARLIYTFSIKKVSRRRSKWWPRLIDLFRKLSTIYGQQPEETEPDTSGFYSLFKKMMVNLDMTLGSINRVNKGELEFAGRDWWDLAEIINEALSLLKRLREHVSICNQIGEGFSWSGKYNKSGSMFILLNADL
jgi:hypothetical protein